MIISVLMILLLYLCYGLFVSPQNSYVEPLIPTVMRFEGKAFEKQLDYQCGALTGELMIL